MSITWPPAGIFLERCHEVGPPLSVRDWIRSITSVVGTPRSITLASAVSSSSIASVLALCGSWARSSPCRWRFLKSFT